MSTYRRAGSPYWQYDFTVKGLRFRGSTETEDRGAAKSIAAKLRHDAVLGKHFQTKAPISIGAAFERYYEEVAEHQPSGSDVDRMLDHMARFFTETALLSEIGDSRIAEYISTRRGETFRGKLVSNATVNRDVELLRRVYRRAERAWKSDIGTMPDWKAHALPEAAGRIRALSQPEIGAILTATGQKLPDLLPALRFSMSTGLRLMNVLTLKWSQVDLAGKRLTFKVKSKQPGGENLVIPITAPALVEIANQKGLHATYVFTYGCVKKRGKRLRGARLPFTKTGWRARWKKILAAAKIEDFRWHDLRHTAATWTLRETRNLALVKRMLGHADIKSTERYAHVLDEDLAEGMEAAARRIFATTGEAEPPKTLKIARTRKRLAE